MSTLSPSSPLRHSFLILLAVLFLSAAVIDRANAQATLVDEKHSFHPPFLQFGANTEIPNWAYGGAAVATENYIRLTPAVGSRIGWMWNTEPVEAKNWEVLLEFDIHNTVSPGADGIGFWYSKHAMKTGSLYGQAEDFDGFGVVFDTYDNNVNGDGPSVVAIRGHGHPAQWDYDNDLLANQLARCRADFRNAVASSVRAKISYQRGTLSVSVDTAGRGEYTACFQLDRLNLPQGYFFGLTAATGGLSDYHDVYRFEMTDLDRDTSEESRSGGGGGIGRKRRTGRFDPYEFYNKALEKLEQRQKQNVEVDQDSTADHYEDPYGIESPPPPKGDRDYRQQSEKNDRQMRNKRTREEVDEQAFFERLKEKMKQLGMDDESSDIGTDKPNTIGRKTPRQKQTEQQQQQNDAAPSHVAFSNEAVMFIMEGLEQVTRVVRDASTRQDINDIVSRVEQVSNMQQSVTDHIRNTGHEIKGEVNAMSQSIVQRNTELAKEITRLQSLLQRLEQKVHGLTERQGTLQQDIQRTTDIFRDDIRKESSFTFWFFFILFQIAFFAAMIFWKRMRDAKTTRYLD